MTNKLDQNIYQGKERVFTPVPNSPRISRLWIWNEVEKQYQAPQLGKAYAARRYDLGLDGKLKRSPQHYFSSLEEARLWQGGGARLKETPIFLPSAAPPPVNQEEFKTGPSFAEVVGEWKHRTFPRLAEATRTSYEKFIRLYLGRLLSLHVHEITSKVIDEWLDELKNPNGSIVQTSKRKSFKYEVKVLACIFRYYEVYHDDPLFRFPVKARHREAAELKKPYTPRPKDLSEEEFLRFREKLLLRPRGPMLCALATIQYYQALRISEAAGLYWEDVNLNHTDPDQSRLKVMRSVCWPRLKGLKPSIKGGFKNSGTNQGTKEQPIFPAAFETFASLKQPRQSGLIFQEEGQPLEYRWIQYAYDLAFKRAGLPYSSTHVMRHGGTRRVYNEVPDLAVAQQLLGNSDLKSTLVYAKRQASALTKVASDEWKRFAENGCNLR